MAAQTERGESPIEEAHRVLTPAYEAFASSGDRTSLAKSFFETGVPQPLSDEIPLDGGRLRAQLTFGLVEVGPKALDLGPVIRFTQVTRSEGRDVIIGTAVRPFAPPINGRINGIY